MYDKARLMLAVCITSQICDQKSVSGVSMRQPNGLVEPTYTYCMQIHVINVLVQAYQKLHVGGKKTT